MKVQKLNETINILSDLEILCKQYNIEEINFTIFSKSIEFYSPKDILLLLDDNFTGTIENHDKYGYDAGQKFVINLKDNYAN